MGALKAEHNIRIDELTCGLSKVDARVSAVHVKICQSQNIAKDGLILEDFDISQLNGKEVDIRIGNGVPKAHWCRNNAYVNRTLLYKNSLPDEYFFLNRIAKLNSTVQPV